jgi:elongation factor 1-gamma
MTKTNKSSEFLMDFPLGQVPAFKSQGGIALFESDAIAQFAAQSGPASAGLLGANAEESAVIRQWIGFADHNLFAPLQNLVLWRYGMAAFDANLESASLRSLEASLSILEKHLESHRHVATDHIDLADISVAAALYWGFGQVIDRKMREQYPLMVQWYSRLLEVDQIKSAFGEKDFIEVRKEGFL